MDQFNEILNIKRALGYWIPGASIQQMKQLINNNNTNNIQYFREEEFLNEIKCGKATLNLQDDKYLSETEKAYLMAFNPEKRIRSDYECMFVTNDDKGNEMDIEKEPVQKCEYPGCPGTDTKWIECSVGKCWYHQSCAGIPANKTQEEIDQMDWKCKNCKANKTNKKK